jgi:LytS/YehU family sensor histidine kinase
MIPVRDAVLARTPRRIAAAVTISIVVGLILKTHSTISLSTLLLRATIVGLSATAAFTFFEAWPRKLPRWLQRWTLQVIAVGVAMLITTFLIYILSTPSGAPPFWQQTGRVNGWLMLTLVAMLVAPWTALAAIIRQKEAIVRDQNLAFALERSELEREALDARLRVLQAQVAPHFLFNTLANVQALVDTGSPHASVLLRSLTAYLRAAVPLLEESATTIERELQLVRPYLELMQMRMPDRLEYSINVEPCALNVRCPPTTLLTLVENAVRHGIDPSEEGGRIDVEVVRRGQRCEVRVSDTGCGKQPPASGLGTGLTTLRERLHLTFGDAAHLRLTSNNPRGTLVEVDMPAPT